MSTRALEQPEKSLNRRSAACNDLPANLPTSSNSPVKRKIMAKLTAARRVYESFGPERYPDSAEGEAHEVMGFLEVTDRAQIKR